MQDSADVDTLLEMAPPAGFVGIFEAKRKPDSSNVPSSETTQQTPHNFGINRNMKETLLATIFVTLSSLLSGVHGLNVVIAGGTGRLGKLLIPNLPEHDVTVLSRNSYLASAPARVTEVFGYLGKSFLASHPNVKIRDWDGGKAIDVKHVSTSLKLKCHARLTEYFFKNLLRRPTGHCGTRLGWVARRCT